MVTMADTVTTRSCVECGLEMIDVYGEKCAVCGENTPEFLTIDHVNGGGTKHRRQISGDFKKWLKSQGWPKNGYRLLCANCNCSVKANKWYNNNKIAANSSGLLVEVLS